MDTQLVKAEKPPQVVKAQAAIISAIVEGEDWRDIVTKLGHGNRKREQRWRQRILRWASEDTDFQTALGMAAKGELALGTPAIVAALVRRATKGNVQAAKLAMEASGFHNPRVQHEHSGEIQITIRGVNRPAPTEDENSTFDGDAVVVDE